MDFNAAEELKNRSEAGGKSCWGLISRCAIETECKYCTAAAALLKATRTPLLSMACSVVDMSRVLPSNSMINAGSGTS